MAKQYKKTLSSCSLAITLEDLIHNKEATHMSNERSTKNILLKIQYKQYQ